MKNKEKKPRYAISISFSALLCAASVVLAYLAKSLFGPGALRFTVECLPIFIGAFFFGPIVGGTIALSADLISCIISGMAPLPLVTVGAVLIGVVGGVMFKYVLKKCNNAVRITVSVFSGHIVGSMIVKTYALYQIFGITVLFRIPIYFGIAVIESIILMFLMKNKAIRHEIEVVKK